MRRETANVLLVLLGGALMKIAVDGTALRYVKPSMVSALLISGVALVLLAAVAIYRDVRRGGAHGGAAGGHCGTPGHGATMVRGPWLLLLPVLVILLVGPPALGASSVGRSDGRSVVSTPRASTQTFPTLPPGPAPQVRLVDFVQRAVWDSAGELGLLEVTLTGFVVHREPGATELARLVISCCAADALPVLVRLRPSPAAGSEDAPLAALPDNSWISVRATFVDGSATPANGYLPTAIVSSWSPVATPTDPYES